SAPIFLRSCAGSNTAKRISWLNTLRERSTLILVPDSSQRYNLKQRIVLAVVPRLAYMIICLLGVTLRFEDIAEPGATPAYHTPPPLIYALWHRCLLACAWRFRQGKIHILISQSFDGELIARTVEQLGFVAVRGSSSRDGAAGLRNLQ